MKNNLKRYLKSDHHLWWTVTILPGIYSLVYLYLKNYTLVNSWEQFSSFLLVFIALPALLFLILDFFFIKKILERRNQLYWSFLFIYFSINLSLSLYLGLRWKALLLIGVIAIVSSFFIAKHYKKLVLLLGLMSLLAIFQFTQYYFTKVISSKEWVKSMDFETTVFTKKPNIYLLQPDGFVGKKAANNSLYSIDNSSFYETLQKQGFTFNHDFRSNYPTTLASNTTLFTAQHHYLNHDSSTGELINARDIILGDNPVLNTLKNNGYQLNLVLEHSYLMLNYPNIVYDNNNVTTSDLSSLLPNYYLGANYVSDFKEQVNNREETPQFYFVEILHPGHISYSKDREDAITFETQRYKDEINEIQPTLVEMTQFIEKNDPNSIVIIAADHGGFVGFTHTGGAYDHIEESKELKESIFNSLLAIKAPYDFSPHHSKIKSTIAIFPSLFNYLSDKEPGLPKNLDQGSYLFIEGENARGLYQYFDPKGNAVTKKIEK